MFWNFLRDFEAGDFSSWIREGNFIAEPFSTFYTLLGFHSIGSSSGHWLDAECTHLWLSPRISDF